MSERKPYSSNVSDDEWAFVAPYLTLMTEDAPQREYPLREVVCVQRGGRRSSQWYRIVSMDETFILPPESRITLAEWHQTPASVRRWVIDLCAENNQLRETVEVLQELIHRNSQNSSQPSSQDRPEQKPTREASGSPRQRGGQPGHPGHHRTLVEDVDEVVVHKPISSAVRSVARCYWAKTQLPIATR